MQNWADYQANGLGSIDNPVPIDDSGVTPIVSSKKATSGSTPVLTAFGGVVLFLVVTYLFFSPINS